MPGTAASPLAARQDRRSHDRGLAAFTSQSRDDARLVDSRRRLEDFRLRQLDELRDLGRAGAVNVDQSAARRYHSAQLAAEVRLVDHRRTIVAQQLDLCRQALVRADQEVKALEKIEERQRGEFVYEAERQAARELEDAWSAARAVEASR